MSRIAHEGKPEDKLSARFKSDIDKIKIDPLKKTKFKDGFLKKHRRVVNTFIIPPRMTPSKVDRMMFRQEIHQDVGPRPFKLEKSNEKLEDLDKKRFVRVSNNLFRNEESVLDQSERLIFNRNIKREMSKVLNKAKVGEDNKIADIVKKAHIAEKKIIADSEKNFMSKFTGPTKTLIEVPQIKQQLDDNMNIMKRARPSQKDIELDETVNRFSKRFGIEKSLIKGLLPDSREQSKALRQK